MQHKIKLWDAWIIKKSLLIWHAVGEDCGLSEMGPYCETFSRVYINWFTYVNQSRYMSDTTSIEVQCQYCQMRNFFCERLPIPCSKTWTNADASGVAWLHCKVKVISVAVNARVNHMTDLIWLTRVLYKMTDQILVTVRSAWTDPSATACFTRTGWDTCPALKVLLKATRS